MRFLCLAYGDGKDWEALSTREQEALLAQDELLRARGDLVAPVGRCTTVRAVGDQVVRSTGTFSAARVPLAGFSLIEARDLDEAVALVSNTPCARARGAVEVWPVLGEGGEEG